MDIFGILAMVGGLALFLYGMQVLGDGLKRTSGGRLEEILESLTSNKWKGALLGCVVTAVIQSSSATTVMVVGLVNSGIMKLTQAAGVILGANVGTTVTSWMLSLTGIESSNVFVQLLKPANFSPIVGIIGVIMLMTAKNDKKKDIGTILIGFAVLMFGMETMSSAVEPLAGNEKFTGILTMFSNPILGMLAGLVLTAVIQSSSASIGILQALCLTGMVPFSAALPIIMGQNIGTCITAILSAIGANVNAKRAAMIHLYFNLIGTVLFMAVFYTVNAAVHFSFMPQAATQPADGNDQASAMANSMKTMNMVMPLMSAFFCFTFPVGLGIYWIASAVVRSAQQFAINRHLDKMNIDDLVNENMKKIEAKRAKEGLPPQKITNQAHQSAKNINKPVINKGNSGNNGASDRAQKVDTAYEKARNAKPGSITAKANLVRDFDERNKKK